MMSLVSLASRKAPYPVSTPSEQAPHIPALRYVSEVGVVNSAKYRLELALAESTVTKKSAHAETDISACVSAITRTVTTHPIVL